MVAEPGGDHVHRDAVREQVRRVCVPKDVKRPDWNVGCLPLAPEGLGGPLRVDRRTELVGEDEVVIDVALASERALE